MLRFANLVAAVYFYHKHTNRFLGIVKRPTFHSELIVPVDDIRLAVDFKVSEGGEPVNPNYNPKTLQEMVVRPSNNTIRIQHPTKKLSWDQCECKSQPTKKTILYPTSATSVNQIWSLIMQADLSFIFKLVGNCMKYDEKEDVFILTNCDDMSKSSFLVSESAIPLPKESNNESDTDFVSFGGIRQQRPKNVTSLTFKDDKAFLSGKIRNDDFKFSHQVVDIKNIQDKLEPVSPREVVKIAPHNEEEDEDCEARIQKMLDDNGNLKKQLNGQEPHDIHNPFRVNKSYKASNEHDWINEQNASNARKRHHAQNVDRAERLQQAQDDDKANKDQIANQRANLQDFENLHRGHKHYSHSHRSNLSDHDKHTIKLIK